MQRTGKETDARRLALTLARTHCKHFHPPRSPECSTQVSAARQNSTSSLQHRHPFATQIAMCEAVGKHLQVEGQQCGVPVIGDEYKVLVAIWGPAAGHMPGRLQCGLAQQRAAKQDALPVAPIDVPLPPLEAGVVHKDIVHPVDVPVEVPHLHMHPRCHKWAHCQTVMEIHGA